MLGLLLLAVVIFEPNCFRFCTRQLLFFEAWRNGVKARIGGIEGSIFEPLKLRESVWMYESEDGPITRIEIQMAVAEFSWRSLLSRNPGRWFQRLSLEGVSGKIQLPLEGRAPTDEGIQLRLPRPGGGWIPAPERIEARDVDFVFQSDGDYVRLMQTRFTLSDVEAGSIRAGQILIRQPWLARAFHEVQGTTKMDGATIDIANLTLEPGVQVRHISVDLGNLARGFLNLELDLAAFGGAIRIEGQTLHHERVFAVDATTSFSQISLAGLATFLGASEAAGGTIKEGKFTFRGPPQRVAEATATLHFEAANFQWESRQWDSLVARATLMDGRVQIPVLALTQGHNQLNLSGEMALPVKDVAWWQSEFTFNIAARIENLTELSALLLPEFKFAAGRANIDGSVRGKNQQFNGQVIVSGSDLQWRNAPIEELHASVKINGNELQVTNLSLFNNGDFVRGRGVVNILGDKQYWGEVHASIQDLAKYSAILQKPLVPEPLAGGAMIQWSGEGSTKGQSGKFLARLQKVRSLGATAALLHPINADLEGTYSAGGMIFSRFSLADDESAFTANVAIGSKILSLQGIRLMHQQALWLEGDAFLPFDLWNAWPNTSLATLLDDQTVGRVNLTAHDLQLREASLLTGWKFPIEGLVQGHLSAEGPIGALTSSGRLELHHGRLPLGAGAALTDVEADASFEGQNLKVAKFAGQHPAGDFAAAGEVDFSNLRDPVLKLAVTSEKSVIALFANPQPARSAFLPIAATGALRLQLNGPFGAVKVEGNAEIALVIFDGTMDLAHCLAPPSALALDEGEWPPPFAIGEGPWRAWSFDVHCIVAQNAHAASTWTRHPVSAVFAKRSPAIFPNCELAMDLRLTGTGANPAFAGSLGFQQLPAHAGSEHLVIEEGLWEFRPGAPRTPSISLRISATAFGENFSAWTTSVGGHRLRVFLGNLPVSEAIAERALGGEYGRLSAGDEDALRLDVSRFWLNAVDLYPWAAIPEPMPLGPPITEGNQ